MIPILKNIYSWIKQLFGTIYFFLRQLRHSDFKQPIKYEVKDRPLVILANGPSFKNVLENLDVLKGSDVCCLNHFAINDVFFQIKPNLYVLADPGYWIDHQRSIEDRAPVFENLLNKVDWSMELYVPFLSKKEFNWKTFFSTNKNIKICYIHNLEWTGFSSMRNWSYRKGLAMPRPQNVTVVCLFVGINKGYKKIDIYGVDHSWTELLIVNDKNQVCLCDRHFWDQDTPPTQVWYKIDHPYLMHEALRDIAYMFESYHYIRSYADSRNVRIVNHTKNSYIDAFERA